MQTSSEPILQEDSRQAEDELPALYAAQGLTVQVPVLISAWLIAWLASDQAPRWLLISWVGAVATIPILRVWVNRVAARARHIPISKRLNAIAIISALGGIVHGQSVGLWPYLSDLERTVQSMFLLGLCAAAVATVYGCMRIYLAYLIPVLVQLAFGWARALAGPNGSLATGASSVMLLMLVLFGGVMVVLARGTFRLFKESFDSRQRLRSALEKAESANRSKTRFLASASHDLRQPMHTLSLFSAALEMRPLDAETRQLAKQMKVALQALSAQLDTLLDISKLDAGIVTVNPSTFPLTPFLARLSDDFGPIASRKGLNLRFETPADTLCQTDPLLLERVLRNLLDNAIKYTSTGEITLTAMHRGEKIELQLQDTGLGIAQAEQDRVFEEFYQLGNPGRDRTQGLGLGLSIVRRLSVLLDLNVSLQSTLGKGTSFTLQLPIGNGVKAPKSLALTSKPTIDGLRILVVDDEESIRDGMHAVLEALGCTVQLAVGTDEAEKITREAPPDIVLADFRLSADDDGLETIRRLRAVMPRLPALLVSGDTAPERLREAHATGLRLLHKPVSVETLTAAIREEIDRYRR